MKPKINNMKSLYAKKKKTSSPTIAVNNTKPKQKNEISVCEEKLVHRHL